MNNIVNGKGVADGQIKYWYDGQLVLNLQNVIIRTAQNSDMKFNQLVIAPYIGDGSPVDQTFWIDNLVVSTGQVGDDTLPSAPTGLRIVESN